jgi:hypothetical protein
VILQQLLCGVFRALSRFSRKIGALPAARHEIRVTRNGVPIVMQQAAGDLL